MKVLVENGRVLDGTGGPAIERGAVLIEDELISIVGPSATISGKDADVVIDAEGGVIMPGLFDCHVHFLGSSQTAKWSKTDKTLYGVRQGTYAINAGITTARDVGAKERSIFNLREHFERGDLIGPTILASGAMICMTGGHGSPFNSRECDGVDEVRKGTREQLKAGADWIKLSASGGAATANEHITSVQLDPEEMAMVVHEARKAGKYVAAHAHASKGIQDASRVGIRTIEHGVLIDDETASVLAENGTWLVPTISVYPMIVRQGPAFNIPDYMTGKAAQVTEYHFESTARALEAGVQIAFGTDAAAPYNSIGNAVVLEAQMLHEVGMSLNDVLVAATSGSAKAMGVDHEVGTLEVGKRADVIVLEGDPLSDPTAYGTVRAVVSRGRVVKG